MYMWSHFENRGLLKPVIVSVAIVATFIKGHERTLLNRVGCFSFITR